MPTFGFKKGDLKKKKCNAWFSPLSINQIKNLKVLMGVCLQAAALSGT